MLVRTAALKATSDSNTNVNAWQNELNMEFRANSIDLMIGNGDTLTVVDMIINLYTYLTSSTRAIKHEMRLIN